MGVLNVDKARVPAEGLANQVHSPQSTMYVASGDPSNWRAHCQRCASQFSFGSHTFGNLIVDTHL